ncbi:MULTISPECIES: hypothetical protein [unclassified Brevundimonas]|uniref:hypothetical protein n=1 Tax=unclassified Brevundimonas TaxID=2622653 RepID=UPI003F9397DF
MKRLNRLSDQGIHAQIVVGLALAAGGVLVGTGGRTPALFPAVMIVAGVVVGMSGVFALIRPSGAANDR